MLPLRALARTDLNAFAKLFLVQMVELVSEAICAALLLLSGKWFVGLLQLGLLVYMSKLYASRKLFVDTTDAFRQLPEQKKQRFIFLGVHLTLFIVVVYR